MTDSDSGVMGIWSSGECRVLRGAEGEGEKHRANGIRNGKGKLAVHLTGRGGRQQLAIG